MSAEIKERILKTSDVCKILNLHRHTVYKLVKNGKLKWVRINDNSYCFKQSDIEAYIKSSENH